LASSHAGGSLPPLPATEAELLRHRPSSHLPGAFPRKLLLPGERILYEGRSAFFSRYWGRLSFILVFWLLIAGGSALNGQLLDSFALTFYGLMAFLLLLVWLAWRRSAFALTDRRVLAVEGLLGGEFHYALTMEVQRLAPPAGLTSDLRFEVAPARPAGPNRRASTAVRRIVWRSVEQAPQVYEFVQQAFAVESNRASRWELKTRLLTSLQKGRVECEYCGTLIAIEAVQATGARCPRCSAPIALDSPDR
jgi:hypothetical protein